MAVLVLGLMVCTGCGSKPRTYRVAGVVKVNGQPATGANVTLHPASDSGMKSIQQRPFGKVKEDGSFELSTFSANDGAPAGEYVLTIYWPTTDGDNDQLNGDYESPERPDALRVVVNKSKTEWSPIEINTKAFSRR
ncbi:MAG: hypothetical protein K8T89_04510 [Planctomycetes bacterium]|nr:hypothetical protein [Planctomycetota bacterium]